MSEDLINDNAKEKQNTYETIMNYLQRKDTTENEVEKQLQQSIPFPI